VFLLCRNTPGTLLGYLGCLLCGAAALLLDAQTAPELLERLAGTYRPAFFLHPGDLPPAVRAVLPQRAALELRDCALLPTGEAGPELHPDLALLLTTSGSTGSPKLVRLSGKNLQSNAGSIARYLELTREERPITTLPMSYSYGMSIVNSHVLAGAAPLLPPRGGFGGGGGGIGFGCVLGGKIFFSAPNPFLKIYTQISRLSLITPISKSVMNCLVTS